jgi:hypothetical protein
VDVKVYPVSLLGNLMLVKSRRNYCPTVCSISSLLFLPGIIRSNTGRRVEPGKIASIPHANCLVRMRTLVVTFQSFGSAD